jgi:hypothetical protein
MLSAAGGGGGRDERYFEGTEGVFVYQPAIFKK